MSKYIVMVKTGDVVPSKCEDCKLNNTDIIECNSKGEMILFPNCDSIKKMGEYILVKRNKEYGLLDADGNIVAEIKYRKVRFERNTLYLQNFDKSWLKIE